MLSSFRIITTTALALGLVTISLSPAFAGAPIGYFVTTDDKTDAPRALIELTFAQDGTLSGFARGTFIESEDPRDVCHKCKGDLEGKPLINLPILVGLREDDKDELEWKGGRITDPDNGQTYKAKLKFDEDYARVKVRGYIGTPALGRSQIWRRATTEDIDAINTRATALELPLIDMTEEPTQW